MKEDPVTEIKWCLTHEIEHRRQSLAECVTVPKVLVDKDAPEMEWTGYFGVDDVAIVLPSLNWASMPTGRYVWHSTRER